MTGNLCVLVWVTFVCTVILLFLIRLTALFLSCCFSLSSSSPALGMASLALSSSSAPPPTATHRGEVLQKRALVRSPAHKDSSFKSPEAKKFKQGSGSADKRCDECFVSPAIHLNHNLSL